MPQIAISNVIQRIQDCGTKDFELVNLKSSKTVLLPVYCDSRSCDNPGCKDHRGISFSKKHAVQIMSIQSSMQKPKAWVFTGYVLQPPLEDHRKFICEKTLLLYKILKQLSSSEFSLHCEIIPSKRFPTCFYVHWHVVTGGLKDYHYAQSLWGRYIEYEKARNIHSVAEYVSKYASKTPVHLGDQNFLPYLQTTYKLRLHRFSTKQGEITKSDWVPITVLVSELKRSANRHRLKHEDGSNKDFVPYVDAPPPPDSDIPACVHVNKVQTWTADPVSTNPNNLDTYENYVPVRHAIVDIVKRDIPIQTDPNVRYDKFDWEYHYRNSAFDKKNVYSPTYPKKPIKNKGFDPDLITRLKKRIKQQFGDTND